MVVEKFHLIRHINRALDKVRTRLPGGNRRSKRRDLFKSRYTLPKGAERLVDWEKARLNELFYRYPELRRAWVLKENFRGWYRGTNRSRAEERLELLEERIANDHLPSLRVLRWKDEAISGTICRMGTGV